MALEASRRTRQGAGPGAHVADATVARGGGRGLPAHLVCGGPRGGVGPQHASDEVVRVGQRRQARQGLGGAADDVALALQRGRGRRGRGVQWALVREALSAH